MATKTPFFPGFFQGKGWRPPLNAEQQTLVLAALAERPVQPPRLDKGFDPNLVRVLERSAQLPDAFVAAVVDRMVAEYGLLGFEQAWSVLQPHHRAEAVRRGAPLTRPEGAHFSLVYRCIKDGKQPGMLAVWDAMMDRAEGRDALQRRAPDGASGWAFLSQKHYGRLPGLALGQAWVSRLHAQGVDINAQNQYGNTALMTTAYPRLLIEAGADTRLLNHTGMSALHHAALVWSLPMLQELLTLDSTHLNTPNRDGDTPLHLALRGHGKLGTFQNKATRTGHGRGGLNHEARVLMLLEAGADPTLPNAAGVTAQMLWHQDGLEPIGAGMTARVLEQALADLPTPSAARRIRM